MTNENIFLGSGASITFIPETDIYFPIQETGSITTATAHTDFSNLFSLVNNLYVGCLVEAYTGSTLDATARITGNTHNTITFSPSITIDSGDYLVIRGYGAPVPAPKTSSGTNTHVAQVLTIGFSSTTKGDYNDNSITFGQVPSADGTTSTQFVIGITTDGSYAGASADLTVDVSDAQILTREDIIDVIVAEVAKDTVAVAASRSGSNLILTNEFGGAVAVPVSQTVSDSTNNSITITTAGTTTANADVKRLLSDQWLGLLESATFPNTEVEMKQMNLSLGGSRNYTYQYKGIETATGGNLGLVSNHASWLYYFFGRCTSITASLEAATMSTHFAGPSGRVIVDSNGATGDDTTFTSTVDTGPIFIRTSSTTSAAGTTLCPPVPKHLESTVGNMESLKLPSMSSGSIDDAILYTFEEEENDELPSFALEQVFSKLPSTNTYRTNNADADEDTNFVKIARGNRVNTLTITANENEEIKMTMDLNTRTVHSLEKTEIYEARKGVTDETSFFNYDSTDEFREPFFFSRGYFKIFGQQFLKINSLTLTMNNNLQDRRFIGVGNKSIKEGIPAQRTYELQFTGHVTDDKLYNELLNQTENDNTGQYLELQFEKSNGENFNLKFTDYFISANNFPMADDKGPIVVEATVMPRTLQSCTVKTHWILQG